MYIFGRSTFLNYCSFLSHKLRPHTALPLDVHLMIVEPEKYMEKVLYTIDELTGLVTATALMRPEKMKGISVKSIKKKWKDKSFAAGVNREVITQGAEMLGMDISDIIQLSIDGMTRIAPELGLWPSEG